MKILHVIHRYPPARGGSEKYFEEISRRLLSDGHQVEVWTTDTDELEGFWSWGKSRLKSGTEVQDNVTVRRFRTVVLPQHPRLQRLCCLLPSNTIRGLFHFPSPFVPGLLWQTKFGRQHFDLVHATALPYTSILLAGLWCARKSRCPLCITPFMHIGESESDTVRKWYTRADQIRILTKASLIFVQTCVELGFLTSIGIDRERCRILGVGINPEEIVLVSPPANVLAKRYDLEKPYVFTLGAKSCDKGTPTVIEAMQEVWEKRPDIRLVLAGDEMNDFKTYWNQVPQASRKRILLLGRVDEDEKTDLLKNGLIYLNPSQTDSFGITFLEAWMWEKPVIGASAGGVVDVIDHGTDGFLVPFGDAKQLARRILELADSPQLRDQMGSNGKDKTLARYTWDRIYTDLIRQYETLTR